MLELTVAPFEIYNDDEERFITFNEPTELQLEHSLRTISSWESKWHTPFLKTNASQEQHTREQLLDYMRCMIINGAPKECLYGLTNQQAIKIREYMNDPMTATVIYKNGKKPKVTPPKQTGKIITSEEIYYWMIEYGIPFDPCERWHLNRLLMLINVAREESREDKPKMSTNDLFQQQRRLNAARRAKHHTKG